MKIATRLLRQTGIRPQEIATGRWRRKADGRVLTGPFEGMLYSGEGHCSSGAAKLMGTYEMELWPALERMIAASPGLVIDIGAAEGFYAVGLARRLPDCRIVAFEAEDTIRPLILSLAEANGAADRIHIRGSCDAETLAELIGGCEAGGAMIMDVEGAEFDILSPEIVGLLKGWRLIVEVHPWRIPNAEEAFRSRLCGSHQIHKIPADERKRSDIPGQIRSVLLDRWTLRDMREFRPPGMFWMECLPAGYGKA